MSMYLPYIITITIYDEVFSSEQHTLLLWEGDIHNGNNHLTTECSHLHHMISSRPKEILTRTCFLLFPPYYSEVELCIQPWWFHQQVLLALSWLLKRVQTNLFTENESLDLMTVLASKKTSAHFAINYCSQSFTSNTMRYPIMVKWNTDCICSNSCSYCLTGC